MLLVMLLLAKTVDSQFSSTLARVICLSMTLCRLRKSMYVFLITITDYQDHNEFVRKTKCL